MTEGIVDFQSIVVYFISNFNGCLCTRRLTFPRKTFLYTIPKLFGLLRKILRLQLDLPVLMAAVVDVYVDVCTPNIQLVYRYDGFSLVSKHVLSFFFLYRLYRPRTVFSMTGTCLSITELNIFLKRYQS